MGPKFRTIDEEDLEQVVLAGPAPEQESWYEVLSHLMQRECSGAVMSATGTEERSGEGTDSQGYLLPIGWRREMGPGQS